MAACAVAQHHQHQQQQQQYDPKYDQKYDPKFDLSSTTTWIPILAYNKEQGQDGSYKAS